MLMMMRSDENYTAVEGCTAEELLACFNATDYDACIAKCADEPEEPEEPVGNGFVTISKVSAAATQKVAMNASKKNVWTIKLTAGEDWATISSIVVKRDWLGSNNVSVELTNDKWTITTAARNMNSNGEATVRFSPALELKANESMKLDVLVTLNAAPNEIHNFTVTSANLANGKSEGSAVLGSLETLNYTVTPATVALNAVNSATIKAWETKAVAKFEITPAKDSIINGFIISKWANALQDFDKAFGEVKAYVNNKEVGDVTMTSDKIIVKNLNTEKSASSKLSVELRVSGIFIWNASDTEFALASEADIDVIEKSTNESVQANSTPSLTINLTAAKITSAKLTTWTVTYAPGQSAVLYDAKFSSSTDFDVIWYKLEMNKEFDITKFEWNKITFKIGDVVADIEATDIEDDAVYCTAADVATTDNTDPCFGWTAWTTVKTAATKKFVTFWTNDSFTFNANSDVNAKVTANIKDTATATTTNMQFTVTLTKIRDVENSSNVITAGLPSQVWDQTAIALWTLQLKSATIAAPASRNIWSNASDLEVARFAVSAVAENVSINKITVENKWTVTTLSDTIASAKLVKINEDKTEEVIATASNSDINDTAKTITFEDVELTAEKDVDINVKLVVSTKTVTLDEKLLFDVSIAKEDAIRESWEAVAANASYAWTAATDTYTCGIKSPEVTLTKISDSLFKVTIKNLDGSNAMQLNSVDVRVKAVADNSDYKWVYCLRQEGSSDKDCKAYDTNTFANWADGKAKIPWPTTVFTFGNWTPAPISIAKNSSYTFEIYVDSDYVNPTTLMAEFTKATYNTSSSENYELSAQ